MKNLLLTVLFFFILIFQINAQYIALYEEPQIKISQEALNWENQKLRSDLTLTDNQFNQIKDITLERSKARSIVASMFKNEPKKLENKLQEIDGQFDSEFGKVLNAKQFKKYLTLQARKAKDVKETEHAAEQSEGPNFNARIQEMISKATSPLIDPSLKPKQDTTSLQISSNSIDLLQVESTGIDDKSNIAGETKVLKENPASENLSGSKQEINAAEGDENKIQLENSENKQAVLKSTDIQKSEENIIETPEIETNSPGN